MVVRVIFTKQDCNKREFSELVEHYAMCVFFKENLVSKRALIGVIKMLDLAEIVRHVHAVMSVVLAAGSMHVAVKTVIVQLG